MKRLFPFTPAGEAYLDSVRVVQKVGRPGHFGSTGFRGEITMGQAILPFLIHELGHSYWGAIPVTGRSDLSWERTGGQPLSSAMQQYHRDLVAFMRQPPDRYEPLRERFRGMPNLFRGDDPDLYHFGEAELVSMTGGNLRLVPPLLRKYFDRYLRPGQFETFDEFIAWYLGLPGAQRPYADAYLGVGQFGLERYQALRPREPSPLPQAVVRLVQQEERQRLFDFARQFRQISGDKDSLKDAVGVERGFPFWRGYLREMFDLYQKYPDVLRESDLEDGARIARSLDAVREVRDAPAAAVADRLAREPFAYNFLPILSDRVIVELFRQAGGLPAEATQKGAQPFVDKLRENIARADAVLRVAKQDPTAGARELEALVARLAKDERREETDEALRILRETDAEATRRMAALLSPDTVRVLLRLVPASARFLLTPEQLLAALGISAGAPEEQLSKGVAELLRSSSGNFDIDRPYLQRVHALLAQRGRTGPAGTLRILKAAALPLPDFLTSEPQGAVAVLASDLSAAAELVLQDATLRAPPARVVHFVKLADPALAARLLALLDERGQQQVVLDSLVYHAYDAERLQANPGLRVSLAKDRELLLALASQKGMDWLAERSRTALAQYREKAAAGEMDADFVEAYRRTLRALDGLGPSGVLSQFEQAVFPGQP